MTERRESRLHSVCVCNVHVNGSWQTCLWARIHTSQTATHCNTLQHTATHRGTLHTWAPKSVWARIHTSHIETRCNTLQHTATHYKTLQHITYLSPQKCFGTVSAFTDEKRHPICSWLVCVYIHMYTYVCVYIECVSVYIYMYVCTYVWVCMYSCRPSPTRSAILYVFDSCVYICNVHTCVYIYECRYIDTYLHICVCTYIFMSAFTDEKHHPICSWLHICMYTSVCIYTD